MIGILRNPFTWDTKGDVEGPITTLRMTGNGKRLHIKGLSEPIEIYIPRKFQAGPPTLVNFKPIETKYVYHRVKIEQNNSALTAIIRPWNESEVYIVYMRKKLRPTEENYDWKFYIPQQINDTDQCDTMHTDDAYKVFVSDKDLTIGTVWIGVSLLQPPSMSLNDFANLTSNYSVTLYKSQCLYWNKMYDKWKSDGCYVSINFCV